MQIHDDWDVFREHLLVGEVLIEGMLAAAAAHLDAREPNIYPLIVEGDTRAPCGGVLGSLPGLP